jgi:hypothetical protein
MKIRKSLVARSIRLPHSDIDAWHTAAAKLEISKSAFLRLAIREKANTVVQRTEERREELQHDRDGACAVIQPTDDHRNEYTAEEAQK